MQQACPLSAGQITVNTATATEGKDNIFSKRSRYSQGEGYEQGWVNKKSTSSPYSLLHLVDQHTETREASLE